MAFADWLAGRLVPAERALAELFAERAASERRDLALRAAFDLGGVQQAQGRLGAAQRTYQRGLEVAGSTGSPPTIGMAHVGLAEVGYERDELAAAAEHATVGIEQCRRLAYALALVAGLLTLARIRQAEGDPVGALAAVDEAEAAMPQALVDLRYPAAGAAGPAGAGRGEPRRGRSMGPRPRAGRRRRAGLPPRARVPGARAAAAGRARARGRPRAAGAVAGAGGRPGPGRRACCGCGCWRRWRTTSPATSPPR